MYHLQFLCMVDHLSPRGFCSHGCSCWEVRICCLFDNLSFNILKHVSGCSLRIVCVQLVRFHKSFRQRTLFGNVPFDRSKDIDLFFRFPNSNILISNSVKLGRVFTACTAIEAFINFVYTGLVCSDLRVEVLISQRSICNLCIETFCFCLCFFKFFYSSFALFLVKAFLANFFGLLFNIFAFGFQLLARCCILL